MKDGLPLIFFHKGDSYYLQFTFNQVLQTNPHSEIYLIGDKYNKHYADWGIKHIDMTTCEKTAKEFEKIYVHLSDADGFVERICFQRWMYIRDFLLNAGIVGRFVCLDSDVLIYDDITAYCNSYCSDADVTLHGKYGPGCNSFKDVSVLAKLVDTMFRYYSTPELLIKLKDIYAPAMHEKARNVTDMTMIEAFVEECDVTTYDLLQVVDGKTFDSHITKKTDVRFLYKGRFKKVVFKDGKVYCVQKDTCELVQMLMLHIQGFYKMYMYRYYTGDPHLVQSKWKSRFAVWRLTIKRLLSHFLVRRKGKK